MQRHQKPFLGLTGLPKRSAMVKSSCAARTGGERCFPAGYGSGCAACRWQPPPRRPASRWHPCLRRQCVFPPCRRHADLVNQLAVLGHKWVGGLAAQHVDGSAFHVVRLWRIAKQRPHVRVGQARTRFVFVQRPLQRAAQQVAFGAIGVDHAQARIAFAIRCLDGFAHFGHIGKLPADE
jgi:hypothetical protein